MQGLADDLAHRGYAAWNVEYRRVGPLAGGGYPNTLLDVAAAIDHLAAIAGEQRLDLARVGVVGHSAGGLLTLWAAARGTLPPGAPGADPVVKPAVFIAQAGVADLRLGYSMGLGAGAIPAFVGGTPDEVPERYAVASAIERVPLGVRHVLVHGTRDEHVPVDLARSYYKAAHDAGDDVELIELDCDHMALIDPHHASWQVVVDHLP
jgi:acetyl esterase/lipase